MQNSQPKPRTCQAVYRDYWDRGVGADQGEVYYRRLYARLREKMAMPDSLRILDVAGGNGALMRYLGVRCADILDISESGLRQARDRGYEAIRGDVESDFPVGANTYDGVYCCEVLEHLRAPNRTLTQIYSALKIGGRLVVAQPNMRPDGIYHVRRYRAEELRQDLRKSGFAIDWIDYVPAYSVREAILDDILHNPSWVRRIIQCANLGLSFLPWRLRYAMARVCPDRFALIFVIQARKEG